MPDMTGRATRGYAICTAPRSGSNWLCQVLTSTGALGRPREYFNGHARRVLDFPEYPDDRQAQLAHVTTTGASPNGIYGVKLFDYQRRDIAGALALERDLPGLRLVLLQRRDRLGQAISWVRAIQTGQYRATQPRIAEPAYDGPRIATLLKTIDAEYAAWDSYAESAGLACARLCYEDATQDPAAAVAQIAALFDLGPLRFDPGAIDLPLQRDATSQAWRARFLAEAGCSTRS